MKIAILHKWLKSKHTLMICHLGWEAPRSDLQRSLSKSPLQRWPKRLHLWPRTVQWSSALWVTLTCLFLTTGWLALPAKSIRTKCLSLPRSMPRFSRLMSVGLATPCSSHLPLILKLPISLVLRYVLYLLTSGFHLYFIFAQTVRTFLNFNKLKVIHFSSLPYKLILVDFSFKHHRLKSLMG